MTLQHFSGKTKMLSSVDWAKGKIQGAAHWRAMISRSPILRRHLNATWGLQGLRWPSLNMISKDFQPADELKIMFSIWQRLSKTPEWKFEYVNLVQYGFILLGSLVLNFGGFATMESNEE
jgi:hypothetical protein